jgi:hypothetical protein
MKPRVGDEHTDKAQRSHSGSIDTQSGADVRRAGIRRPHANHNLPSRVPLFVPNSQAIPATAPRAAREELRHVHRGSAGASTGCARKTSRGLSQRRLVPAEPLGLLRGRASDRLSASSREPISGSRFLHASNRRTHRRTSPGDVPDRRELARRTNLVRQSVEDDFWSYCTKQKLPVPLR